LYISKGNVEAQHDYAARDPSNLMLGNPDGSFTDASESAGIVNFARARGAALADFNLDGMLDLVEVNRREPIELWRSVGWGDAATPASMGGWIALQLDQEPPNVDGIGSWVEVRTGGRILLREITVGGGHAGGQLGWIHFGVGDADSVEIRVQWPDGEKGPWLNVRANQFVTVERGERDVAVWRPEAG
ncbi:MAG: CRTAC1 family protein, partial [Acidimicrobiia bacterium]